jgi:hypothetical protein
VAFTQTGSKGVPAGRVFTANGGGKANFDQKVWNDILGHPSVRGSGPVSPALSAYRGGNIDQFSYSAGDESMFEYHIPHDYAPGTDVFLHFHWSHNAATSITGNMTWGYSITAAKGHNRGEFGAEVSGSVTYATVDLTTTPRYRQRIDEVQISAASPSASQFNTNILEPDALILCRIVATAIPTIVGGSVAEPFLHEVDVHYQSMGIGTINREPDFYR